MIKNLFTIRFRSRLSINEGGEILMSWKSLTCLTVFCALVAGQALAAPTINVDGVVNGANVDWTVSFTPDAALLAGGEGALAVEVMFESTDVINGGWVINADWSETINGTPIVNPGQNPYTGGITEGVTPHNNVSSQLTTGTVNALFAALGSTKFTTNGPKLALSFSTALGLDNTSTLNWGGIIAQDQDGPLVNISGSKTVGEPVNPIYGDTDNDGDIDLQDLLNVQNNFGLPSPPNLGDTDFDGDIDLQDLLNVQNNFGLTPTSPPGALTLAGASQVPEPATVAIMSACGLIGLLSLKRRK
jgi:hypothetical protein